MGFTLFTYLPVVLSRCTYDLLTNICVDEVPAPRSRPTTVRQGNGGLKALKTSKNDWSPEVKDIFLLPHTRAVGACVDPSFLRLQMRGPATTRLCCLYDVEQEASADDELSLDELRLSDRKGSNLAFELDWGQLFASKRHRTNKGTRNRSKGAPSRPGYPNPAAAEPHFPALPSRHATVPDAGSAAAAASASASASSCYACLGCGCDACLSSSPTAWRGANSTRAALREAVAAMDEGRSELVPRSRMRERQREPRGKRSRAPPRHRPAPQADDVLDTLTPAAGFSKGAARRLIGKRSHSVAQVRQGSVRQARRTAEAAGSWERQPRLVLKTKPQASAKLAAANSPCLDAGGSLEPSARYQPPPGSFGARGVCAGCGS